MPTIDERELEDFLMADPDNLALIGCEVGAYRKIYRQFRLGSYGVADIVVIEPENGPSGIYYTITIIELKRGDIDVNALIQACRYQTGIRHHFDHLYEDGRSPGIIFRIVLVGSQLNLSDWVYLGTLPIYPSIFTYSISLVDGIRFQEVGLRGFKQTNPTFASDFDDFNQTGIELSEALSELIEAQENQAQRLLPAPPETEGEHGKAG